MKYPMVRDMGYHTVRVMRYLMVRGMRYLTVHDLKYQTVQTPFLTILELEMKDLNIHTRSLICLIVQKLGYLIVHTCII